MTTPDPVLEESRQLLRQHVARLGRIWFLGAVALFLVGGAVALWLQLRLPPGEARSERLLGALAVMGLGLPLVPLGLVQVWLGRRLVDRGELTTCRIAGSCPDSLAASCFGGTAIHLFRNVVPVRIVPFTPEGEERMVPGRLFADEVPIADEAGYRCLRTSLWGRPVWLLVCNRGAEPPAPADPIEETGRFAAS